jgi:uncharacterized heparinase superfamily protein
MSASDVELIVDPDQKDDAILWRRFAGIAGDSIKSAPKAPSGKRASDHRNSPPTRFRPFMHPLIPADKDRAGVLMTDGWRIGHERLQLENGAAPWSIPAPSRHYSDRLHRFEWLSALLSESPAGTDKARAHVDDWIKHFGTFHSFHWRLSPLVVRVWEWMLTGPALFETGPAERCQSRLDALIGQVDFVRQSLETCTDPATRWRGVCVLVADALCLREGRGAESALAQLETECTAQILPDGGHVSRSPEVLLRALADLIILRDAVARAGREEPAFFAKWIPRMGAMLGFFQLADGGLCPFNAGSENRPEAVNAVLAALDAPPRNFSFAMKSGFQKLKKRGLCLILDAGAAPPSLFAGQAHSGPLSFELSDGPDRLVTSCGFSPEINLDWQAAVRRTGAHSTLSLAGRDASTFSTFEPTRLLSPEGPVGISAKRLEEADEIWLDAQHGGWKQRFGLIHRRRLFMSGGGDRLTGEDSLVRPVSQALDETGKFVSFDIRFHLHPGIKAATRGDAIELETEHGALWRFRTTHPGTRLELSRYLGRGLVEPTVQIVMSGQADPNGDGAAPPNCIRWGFRKEHGPS